MEIVTATRLPAVSRMEKCVVSWPTGRGLDAGEHGARQRLVRTDARSLSGGIVLADELGHRRRHEIRIAQIHGTIPVGALHGRDDPVLARGRVDLLEIDAGENIERVEQGDASGGRRRGGHDACSPVLADQRFALDDPIVGEILQGPDAAARAHTVHQILGDPSRIESARALVGQSFERGRKLRLLDDRAQLGHLAVRRQEHLRCIRRTHQPLALVADRALQPRVQRESVARQPDRGLQTDLQGELAEFPREVVEGGRLSRDRRRQRSVGRGVRDRVAGGVEVHVAGRGPRRLLARIQHGLEAVGLTVQQIESAAAEARARGLDDGQRGGHGDRGVECIPAVSQDLLTGFARQGIRAGDGALVRDRVLVRDAGGSGGIQPGGGRRPRSFVSVRERRPEKERGETKGADGGGDGRGGTDQSLRCRFNSTSTSG